MGAVGQYSANFKSILWQASSNVEKSFMQEYSLSDV